MPPRHSKETKSKYFKMRETINLTETCRLLGITRATAYAWEKGMQDESGASFREVQALKKMTGPIPYEKLSKEAKRAHDDFEYFRRRYFGRVSSPWQVDAANQFVLALASPRREFICLNCPPGSGKSTLLHDICAWLTVRNRAIRGLVGSATQRLANRYNQRLLRTFERATMSWVDPSEVAAGRAVEPTGVLAADFGRFRPDNRDLWRQEEFIVAQLGDVSITEKEPTWQAYGLDTEFLGNRINIGVWDDVVTKRTMRTQESIEKQRIDWDNEAETRIEPSGANFLVGQRLGPADLYAYNLAKLGGENPDEDEWDGESVEEDVEPLIIDPHGSEKPRKYHRLVYPAHVEKVCKGKHSEKNPVFWTPDGSTDGCLLDPIRLPYRELRGHEAQDPGRYRTVYQQEDVDPGSVLVPREFITGGQFNGEELPGCYDNDRRYHELPRGLSHDTYSICTVDPSPTKWWSVQWWLYDPDTERRHFMEMARQKMEVEDFLSWNPDEVGDAQWSGVLDDMWKLSDRLGRKFTYLIIERNGSQRFLGQLDYFKRWCQYRGVSHYAHDTYQNKSDPEYGVQILRTQYRHGRVRLPNSSERGDMGFIITRKLVDEVTVWPNGTTDDCVMAQWFLEWWIPRLVVPNMDDIGSKWVPSWAMA